MTPVQVTRSLQSIGKACFVKYLKEFANVSLSSEDLIELLQTNERYKKSGCITRISQARRIIRTGQTKAALVETIKSPRLADETVAMANELLRSTP